MNETLKEGLMWLGVWVLVFDLIIALPLFFYLRRMSRKKFIYIMYVLHHWLQNFDKGYGHQEAERDLLKVKDYV